MTGKGDNLCLWNEDRLTDGSFYFKIAMAIKKRTDSLKKDRPFL